MEHHHIMTKSVAHRTEFAAGVRAAVRTTVTQPNDRNCGVKPCPLGRRSGDKLYFLIKADPALVPVMVVCCSEIYQSVDALSWPVRSPNLSPIEHAWNVIRKHLQHHPKPVITISILRLQVQ
ncbi:hypothetical protein TNCV_1745601 [Trichonephila clavipes]|nr:hypothetical protein TNCV_1745601 [Trichonephila clavipes]